MKFPLGLLLFIVLLNGDPLPAQNQPPEKASVEVLEHSWNLDEDWPKIRKTKYSWRVLVRNNTPQRQRVWLYYSLLDETGHPLARNATNRRMAPNQILEIQSDSYIDTTLKSQVESSRVVIKSRSK